MLASIFGLLTSLPVLFLVYLACRLMPSATRVNTEASRNPSQQLWCRRISMGTFVVPGIVILAFIFLMYWKFYGNGPGLPPYLPYFTKAAVTWKVTAVFGLLFALRASYLARWSGPDLELVATHLASIAFIWIAPMLPYALRAD